MKFKNTLIAFAVFLVLLVFFFITESKKSGDNAESRLVNLNKEDIGKIVFETGEGNLVFERTDEDKWIIIEPLQTEADSYEINSWIDDFAGLTYERVVEESPADLDKYQIPRMKVILYPKDQSVEAAILIGMENPLDKTFFAKLEGDERIVLIGSSFKSKLDKRLFDFRRKDIFQFESDDVTGLKLIGKKELWSAEKKDGQWHLRSPVNAMAQNSKLSGIINSLSGMMAKQFMEENKTPAEMKKYGLDNPMFTVRLEMPASSRSMAFQINRQDDLLYVTTSDSDKIIQAETSLIEDLQQEYREYREKKVAHFYSWNVQEIKLKKGSLELSAAKNEAGEWNIREKDGAPADQSKVEDFIRKAENLEASDFIDPPFTLESYALKDPEITITIKHTEGDAQKEIILSFSPLKDNKDEMVIHNPRFTYLFKSGISFLDEFPEKIDDWLPDQEEEAEKSDPAGS